MYPYIQTPIEEWYTKNCSEISDVTCSCCCFVHSNLQFSTRGGINLGCVRRKQLASKLYIGGGDEIVTKHPAAKTTSKLSSICSCSPSICSCDFLGAWIRIHRMTDKASNHCHIGPPVMLQIPLDLFQYHV